MIPSEETNWISPLFIVAIIAAVLGLLYFISTDFYKQKSSARSEFDYGGRPVQSISHPGQIILQVNERKTIGKNGLVYRGMKNRSIIVDLYLLEMDPEQAYEKKFSRKGAKKKMILGDGMYHLVSANANMLVIKEVSSQ